MPLSIFYAGALLSSEDTLNTQADYDRNGIAFINLGSLLAQIVQISGYPTMLSIALSRADYPTWVIGVTVSLQWVIVLVLAPFMPSVLNRFGLRKTCQAGAICSLFAVTLLLVFSAMPFIIVSSLLMGVGLTLRWVACDTWIVESTPEHLRGRIVGLHETLMGLGIAIGPIITLLSAGNEGAALIAFAAILALSIASFAFGADVDQPNADINSANFSARSKTLFVFKCLLLALLAAVVAGYIETAIVALLPIYLMNFNYLEASTLLLLSVFGLGGTLLQAPIGWIADRWGFHIGQILCAGLIFIGGLLIIAAIKIPLLIAVALFFWGGCVGGLNTLAVIEAGASLRGGLSGTGMALIASSYTLGGVVGPIISGATLNFVGGHGAIIIMVGLALIYLITVIGHKPESANG
jgi:MFS family permease